MSSKHKLARLTVLISGSGTNLQAIIDACNTPKLPNTCITRVISDRKDAYGLKRAEAAGIPTKYHGVIKYKQQFPDDHADPQKQQWRQAFDADLAELVLKDPPDLIVCAGYMKILTPSFLEPISKAGIAIINLHPALHGDLVGARCIERAWEEFQKGKRTKTGAMVHYVIVDVDMGEPIVQREVDITGCETLEQLQERIHKLEHVLIVEGAKAVLETSQSRP
ncbi:hypothetical protein AMS68_006439 [Peltaster fructicola]|uniref:Phosphoribosylglycinamide formyltransferase n=1 Tax=Peltaster fructicola TaxID=286661 RepID=A0A6H0Y1L1_9PEZI|nr:hypothetical protein AMS68_006439 [Peltaster fructicola]